MPRRKADRHADAPGRSAATTERSAQDAPNPELDGLRAQIVADGQLLDRLLAAEPSSASAATLEQVRVRFEANLQRTCATLEARLEKAEKRIGRLEEENRELRRDNETLTYRVDRLRLELRRSLGVKAAAVDRDEAAKKNDAGCSDTVRKKQQKQSGAGTGSRGAPKGHRGRSRPVPETVDREKVIAPAGQCSCGCSSLEPGAGFDARYIEDIPPISREVTRLIYLRGLCRNCGRVVRHPDAGVGPPVVTGPNLAAHLTMLNHMGMTFRKLSAFSTHTLGIKLSPAGALGIVSRVAATLKQPYNEVLRHLPKVAWLNGDETGWKVMGRSGYIWCFCNADIAFFHHDFSRGAAVIEDILGKNFKGVVICDFYAAYNCVEKTQRCLVHLLREIKKEREILSRSRLLKRFEKAVKRFIEDGLAVQAMPAGSAKDQAMAQLEAKLDKLTRMRVTKGRAETLVKRIEKYRDNLIRFVTHPDVEFHNNRAERQLRPIVVNRKVSFGSSTAEGARRYCIIHTIVETCKLQNIDPIDFIRRAYLSDGMDVPSLTGSDPPAATAGY